MCRKNCPELTAQAEEAMDNIDYYMKCLNAPSLFAALKILLNSLWENGEDKESDSNSIVQQVEQIHKYIERSYHEKYHPYCLGRGVSYGCQLSFKDIQPEIW